MAQAIKKKCGAKLDMNTHILISRRNPEDQWVPEITQEQHWTDLNPAPKHSPN